MDNAERLAAELGCKIGLLPTVYLGMPSGVKHNSLEVWDGLRKGSVEGLFFGKGIIFPKEGGSHLLKAPSLICLSMLCLCSGYPEESKSDWRKFNKTFFGAEVISKRKSI